MLPLGLSMLWERVEPEAALRERFGFSGFDAATGWVSAALSETWGIAVVGCSRMVISDHNAIAWVESDRGRLVVKWSHSQRLFARLEASTWLLRALADRGVPVAAPVATTDGRDRLTLAGPSGPLSLTVLPELTGDWLDVTDEAAVVAAGACLAEVHRALGAIGRDLPPAARAAAGLGTGAAAEPAEASAALRQRIDDWLARGDRGFAPEASQRLKSLLSAAPDLDDEPQLVHNDFRAANLLTQGSRVVGVLDLDDVTVRHRVHDLAKASVYLGTLFTDWRPTPTAVRQTLRAGYESVRPLSPTEARWLEILVLWQGLQAIPGESDPAGWASAV
ncbi:phosphotransferase enzyme family protein [Antribacter gilvus]|uniref:phosphotransferase enzyme family protein n=1 Tax=Antribacter gilvus TaxID=2304675 RepID=UPI000F76DD7B|nr:phosphotransferase [Antribacter gilvus]